VIALDRIEIFLRVTAIWSDYSGVNSDRHWTKESAKKTKKAASAFVKNVKNADAGSEGLSGAKQAHAEMGGVAESKGASDGGREAQLEVFSGSPVVPPAVF